ncbi:SDR family NAD(P)-dependent oxidoreductase [Sphingomonas oligophenolica]|uniref:SDR family NAD(P)-dependent oxidoreductase n=1 Tax=Sphingomonas oligophenolica TaxID=301154 RepID=A0A502CGK5_9SPHN|nr:SDR family NAD(P)-dependent oxidoreductase [Sphingomonas oligophenolica]TPG12108.1 SDR family NAD(P)-dependent oxidoreductase [Sphingomonas oligophenolica]
MTAPRHALVIGASGGIGAALVEALQDEDVAVTALARSFAGDRHIDIENEASIAAAAARLTHAPDLVIVATGLLQAGANTPEKTYRDLHAATLARVIAVNAIGPALVAKHILPLMPKTGRTVFAALSARVGSIGDNRMGGWYGYRAAKAALNQLIRTLAIEEKRRNDRSIVVALHPGTVDTALSRPFQGNVRPGALFTPARAAVQLLDVVDALKPPDSGKVLDWDGKEVTP